MSLVNDILDLKLIEEGQFEPKMERFKPKEAIDFVLKMLDGQGALSNTKIQVDYTAADAANETSHPETVFRPPPQNRLLSADTVLPQLVGIQRLTATDQASSAGSKVLVGDQIRFKQILINLIKNSLARTRNGLIKVRVSYSEADSLLRVEVADAGLKIADQ